MDLTDLVAQIVRIINNPDLTHDEMNKELGRLLELYRLYEYFALFYKKYLALRAQKKVRHLSIEMVQEILREPTFKALGSSFNFLMFAMLYALTDAAKYFDELRKRQPDIDASLRPIDGSSEDDEPDFPSRP